MRRERNPLADGLRAARLRVPVRAHRRPDRLQLQRLRGHVSSGRASRSTGIRRCFANEDLVDALSRRSRSPWSRWSSRRSWARSSGSASPASGRATSARAAETLLLLPMVTPEIILGISLLLFFSQLFRRDGSLAQISLAHVTFCISYVAIIVRARAVEPRPAAGGGGARPRSVGVRRLPVRHAAAASLPAVAPAPCWPSRSSSTTSS